MNEREQFHSELRLACATVYREQLSVDSQVAPTFGDALAFYASVSGLGWNLGKSLANAGLFYPNRVRRMTDEELLKIKGIGPVALSRLRATINSDLPIDVSTTELMDTMLRMDATEGKSK